MAKLSVSLLGGFSVTLDGKPITSFESNKVRALLAYLVTESDRAHSRDKLAALLWPDMPDQTARSNLRYALSNLRKAIGDVYASQPVLCVSNQTVQINLDGNLDADVLTFSRQLVHSPGLPNLEEAMQAYQGDFLDGFYIGADSAFEEWVVLKREQLRRQALETLHHLVQTYQEGGDLPSALTAGWRLVDLEPWSEESHRELMLLLAQSGRRAAALSQYETCRRVLAEELNVGPSAETTRLYEQIRDGQIKPLVQAPEPEPARITTEARIESPSNISESKLPNRNRQVVQWWKIILAGLLVITFSGIGIYYFVNRSRVPVTSPAHGQIVGPCFEQALPRLCVTNAQTGLITQIAKDLPIDHFGPGFSWSPDGKQIVFSGSKKNVPGEIERAHLYVINKDGTDPHQITSGDTNDILPAWSTDGQWIAFHGNCTLWIVHPDGTEETPLSSGLCATGIAWSPDSRWIAFLEGGMPNGSRLASIRVFERDGSDSRIVYTFNRPVNHGQVAWSPDGQQIFVLYNTGGEQDNTILLDAQGKGAIKQGIAIPLSWIPDFYPQWGK